jgi:putative inorganic carbon (hco3(-)) transporter
MMKRADTGPRLMWWYCVAILLFWVTVPEIRRVLEWHAGFRAFQVLTVVPLVGLTVFAFVTVFRRGADFSGQVFLLAWMWIGSFTYAGVVGWLAGTGNSSVYDLLQAVAPAFVGLWLASNNESRSRAFNIVSGALLLIATLVGIYGIIQFVVFPPWDAAWMQNTGIVTAGLPEPFEVRVFSVLNSPEPCAAILAIAIAFNLNRLKAKGGFAIAALLVCSITLLLTLDRSAWIAMGAAMGVYLIFSASPFRTLSTAFAHGIALVAIFSIAAPLLSAEAGQNSVAQRLQSFSMLSSDNSADSRLATGSELIAEATEYPLGEGLGIYGDATQLTSTSGAIRQLDNGILARLLEMGFVGFAGYAATLIFALGFIVARWSAARNSGDRTTRDIMATLLAVQTLLLVLDFSVDSHLGLTGLLFWITIGIGLHQEHAHLGRTVAQ